MDTTSLREELREDKTSYLKIDVLKHIIKLNSTESYNSLHNVIYEHNKSVEEHNVFSTIHEVIKITYIKIQHDTQWMKLLIYYEETNLEFVKRLEKLKKKNQLKIKMKSAAKKGWKTRRKNIKIAEKKQAEQEKREREEFKRGIEPSYLKSRYYFDSYHNGRRGMIYRDKYGRDYITNKGYWD